VYRDTLGAVERARRVLEVYREGMKVLDVGSGAGFFLLVLEKLSIDAAGLEPNLGYTEFAREELQLHNIFNGVLTEFNSNLTYDIITINHVFEHLDDPSAALQKMGSLLTANGCIIMEIPNIESTYHAPNNIFHSGHLFWYNPVNIEALILKAGFTITDRKVPAGTGHINLIIKKQTTDIPDAAVDLNVLLEGNYDRVKNIRDRHTLIRHYTSPVPYLRFLRKGMQYAREIYHTCNADSCLGIAETICDSKLPGLRTAFRADETNQAPG
jgi:2-polyprenyl-3-methyl-5-hydroxy-6-metoxy-1,4-benzoquinol methylase